jgi:hypothetical protein
MIDYSGTGQNSATLFNLGRPDVLAMRWIKSCDACWKSLLDRDGRIRQGMGRMLAAGQSR